MGVFSTTTMIHQRAKLINDNGCLAPVFLEFLCEWI
jgi:hypothetical protein